MQEVKLTVSFDDYENGIRMENLIRELAAKPEAGTLESLVIGDWGQAYESSPDEFMKVLIELAPSFPSLKSCSLEIWALKSVKFPGLFRLI